MGQGLVKLAHTGGGGNYPQSLVGIPYFQRVAQQCALRPRLQFARREARLAV